MNENTAPEEDKVDDIVDRMFIAKAQRKIYSAPFKTVADIDLGTLETCE